MNTFTLRHYEDRPATIAEHRELREKIARLRSCLMNARNILKDGGYIYATEIDKVLKEIP